MRIVILLLIVLSMSAPEASAAQATIDGFEIVAVHDLGGRGMNAGMAIAGDCGYVGSRSGDQGSLILDLRDAERPEVAGEIPHDPGSTPRELRAVDDLDVLVVMNYRLDPGIASPNSLDLYDIASCRAPEFLSRFDFGAAMPHEFYLWRDPSPAREGRLLAFVAMWGHAPALRVVDLSDPRRPTEIAAWDAAWTTGISSRIHSVTVAPNGRRAYLADWDNGLMVLDTSAIARARSDLTPALLTPPESWLRLPGGNLHSAVFDPDREIVVTTQEIYGPGTCPYGRLHVVDVSDERSPRVASDFGITENDPGRCGETAARDGAFTTHNPLIAGDVAFVSWYAGGLRAIDLSDPARPRESGVYLPDPLPAVRADDVTLQSVPIRVWSSPIVHDGLIYVVDIRNGLSILRYTGAGAAALARIDQAEGNASR